MIEQNSVWAVYPFIEQSHTPSFSDDKHPFMPDDEQGKHPKKVIEGSIRALLESRYQMLKKERGLTYKKWADHCGVTAETLREYRKHPCSMPRDVVEATCELFEVELELMRGRVHYQNSTPEMWSDELLASVYKTLTDDQRKAVTTIVRDLAIGNAEQDMRMKMTDALVQLLDKADD